MDPLTQAALGATVGGVVAGRRIGRQALLWGAFSGLLPDLDKIVEYCADELSSLAFHRSITHSLFFAVMMAPLLATAVRRLYRAERFSHLLRGLWLPTLLLLGMLLLGTQVLPIPLESGLRIAVATTLLIMLPFPAFYLLQRQYGAYFPRVGLSSWQWSQLFFWGLATHALLDSCTNFGTQLFQPFSDYRVAWSIITIIDPLYTLPLLLSLLLAFRQKMDSTLRQSVLRMALYLNGLYLVFCYGHRQYVARVFGGSLPDGLEAVELSLRPSGISNLLWRGTARVGASYYTGTFSQLDQRRRVEDWTRLPTGHNLLRDYVDTRAVQILKWFSQDFYVIRAQDDGSLHWYDLQYGAVPGLQEQQAYFSSYELRPDNTGQLKVRQMRPVQELMNLRSLMKHYYWRQRGTPSSELRGD